MKDNTKKYIDAAEELILHTYNKADMILDKGEGVYLYDTDGKKYLDFGAGIAVMSLGYADKELEEALKTQIDKLLHSSNLYYHSKTLEAAKALTEVSGMEKVFFTNSGTEAIEGALKAARKYAYENGSGRTEYIAMENSFHGRTLGALSVTGTKTYREPFEPLIPGVSFAKYNDIDSLKSFITDKTCAIILEPIQGEGGVHVADRKFLEDVRALCDENDIVLIFDEIQCGMGRSGEYFVWQKCGVKPDILVMAKAIGNGIPVGAFGLTNELALHSLKPGDHGTTYGGNPIALCAVEKVVEIYKKKDIKSNVSAMGDYLKTELTKLQDKKDDIVDVRGVGLIQGIQIKSPVADVVKKARDKGLLIIAAGGNVIRFVPPLIIEKRHVDEMIRILDEIL
ncbi:MAG: aspartate aminotransferase family protein [Suipraeoptans sp.]